MHGRRVCEERKKGHRRHMFRAPSRVISSVETSGSSSLSLSSSTSFCKDGRKINVGDCALFKPPQDCPPFIGLIRLVIPEKEGKLKLRVNWLYRPAELKLGKGILLEAQPNEIFYSFHEDEIPAASLLHPCKVTFLPRGVELPSGISSFVCWRVYDVMNECIWWLTDQDYIDERQQEVDKLLCKTRSEMHTTLQQEGRSPRSMNSPTTSQVKAGSDGVQNNSSFSSQGKGRKRERADQGSESVKRERPSRVDDSGSGFLRTESSLKSEVAKITEKGRLVDSEGVERLVQLMLPEKNEKKIDLIGRSILAGVVAATDKFDCLSRFVQLRGLPVFDEWLQEIHKGKIGDASSPKDNDRSVDDFLLILLRALDKLPVNLNALQTCHIGKSVNHLRSHKNSEIVKKARSLVDTWKKRVEAEMDAKSGSNQGASWPGRPRQSEVSHGGRHSGVPTDTNKTSVSHPHPSKSVSVKIPSEQSMKSATTSPSSTRSAPSSGTSVAVVSDGQQRSTGALHREVGLSRSLSSQRASTSEKVSTPTPEKSLDVPMAEGCNSKLIVKLPKRGRSPTQSVSGGSFEDSAAGNSRAPSPVRSEKPDQFDRNVKEMSDTYRANFSPDANTESSQNNDLKNLSTVSDEVAGSPSVNVGDEHGKAVNDSSKVAGIVKPTSPTVGDDVKTGKRHGGSHSSMNALIESCVRDSEANACMAGADDVGMNLLATVAADEMSKSPVASPSVSRVSDSLMNDNSILENHTTRITNSLGGLPSEQAEAVASEQHVSSSGEQFAALDNVNDSKPGDLDESSDSEIEELQRLVDQCLESNENSDDAAQTAVPTSGIGENMSDDTDSGVVSDLKTDVTSETDGVADATKRIENSVLSGCKAIGIMQNADSSAAEHSQSDVVGDGKNEEKPTVILSSELVNKMGEVVSALSEFANDMSTANVDRSMTEKMSDGKDSGIDNEKADVTSLADPITDTAERVETSMPAEYKAIDLCPKVDSLAVANSPSAFVGENKKEQKPQIVLSSEVVKKVGEDVPFSSGFSKGMAACVDRLVTEKITDMGINHIGQTDKKKNKRVTARLDSSATNGEVEHVEASLKSIEVDKRCATALGPQVVSPAEDCRRPNGSRVCGADGDEVEECTSVARDVPSVSASGGSELEARVEFDLNEGFIGDDTRNGNSNNFSGSLSSAPTPLQHSRFPASITVAAAAKGAFVPREDLLRNKATVGWRGSAATSAFRPAEPRKVQEVVPRSVNNVSSSDASTTAGKQTKTFLDFDLNVPDERVLEDLASQSSANPTNSSGGLDLDLNRLDDPTDMNNHTISSGHRVDSSFQQANLSSGGGRRDFDLNDGPAVDDATVESSMVFSQHSRSGVISQPMISGMRMNADNMAAGFSSWFPAANNYSAMSIPQVLPERGDQPFPVITSNGPQRMVGPTSGVSSFTPDMYRGPVLLSSPAVSFPPTAFQYPGFPFGTSFPLSSSNFSGASTPYMDSSSSGRLCFPPVSSQIVGQGYPRPYVVNLPNGSSNGGVSDNNNAKWFRSGLDLNSGPGGHETDGRDEATLVQRQLSSSGSLPLKDDQARMYQMSGGALKRKEPDGGWDGFKQSSWQ